MIEKVVITKVETSKKIVNTGESLNLKVWAYMPTADVRRFSVRLGNKLRV